MATSPGLFKLNLLYSSSSEFHLVHSFHVIEKIIIKKCGAMLSQMLNTHSILTTLQCTFHNEDKKEDKSENVTEIEQLQRDGD